MRMKKAILFLLVFCLMFVGCSVSQSDSTESTPATDIKDSVTVTEAAMDTEQAKDSRTVTPLPDTTMENLTDAILSISLGEENTYVDEDGHTQMELTIYTFDQYDMVDIATLQIGDILVRHDSEVKVVSKEQNEAGTVFINGGLENGGFDLVTDDCGIYYESGFNDSKSWYKIGAATIRVSADFKGFDCADLDLGEVTVKAEDFLTGAVTNFDFTPYNTTVRVENGQIVELYRAYTP